MLVGCHVSIAENILKAPKRAHDLGCEVFQIFSRPPQGGKAKEITPEIAREFKTQCKKYSQKEWIIHTPYYINFASENNRVKHGSINVVREELERGSLLGAKYVMAHLGSFKNLGREKGMKQLVEGLGKMLKGYKGKTQFLIEIAAGAGEIIGDSFEEIAEIINHPTLKKYKIGVCFDTQHAFASGYDLRDKKSIEKTLKNFDKILGLKKLKAIHCNDSKVELGSHKDRHEHIGDGFIGAKGFQALVNFLNSPKNKSLTKINFYLETQHDKVEQDIKLLKKFRDKK